MGLFAFDIDGDVFFGGVFIGEVAFFVVSAEGLEDGDDAHVGAVGLALEVGDVFDVVPFDFDAVVVKAHKVFEVGAHLIVFDFVGCDGGDAYFGVAHEEFLGAVDDAVGFAPGGFFGSDDFDVFAQVAHFFECEAVDGLFTFEAQFVLCHGCAGYQHDEGQCC